MVEAYRDNLNTPEVPFPVGQINSRYRVEDGGMYVAIVNGNKDNAANNWNDIDA